MRTYLLREESARCKLTDDDIEQIKRMRSEKMTYSSIAKLFNVHTNTVYFHCNPDKSYKYNKKRYDNRKEEWYYHTPEMKEYMSIAQRKSKKKIRELIPWYWKYIDDLSNIRKREKKKLELLK